MTVTRPSGLDALRAATDERHEALEQQTRLPDSLRSVADVAGFLRRWDRLAARLEPRCTSHLDGSLRPTLGADLRRLGVPPEPDGTRNASAGERGNELGTAWVLLGARLGLRTLGPRVAELVGDELDTFRSVDADGLVRLRHQLDVLDGAELATVIEQALAAFAAAGEELGGPPWTDPGDVR